MFKIGAKDYQSICHEKTYKENFYRAEKERKAREKADKGNHPPHLLVFFVEFDKVQMLDTCPSR